MKLPVAFCRMREVSKVAVERLANGNDVLRSPKGCRRQGERKV